MNRILLEIADLPWPKVIFIGLIAAALYWVSGYDNGGILSERLNAGHTKLSAAKSQLEKTKAAMADANRFEQQVKLTAEQFERIGDFMPEKMGPSDLITIINDQASKAGANVVKTDPQSGSERVDFYETAKMNFTLEGNFSQLVAFLSYVSRVPRLLTFEKVELRVIEAVDPERPRLAFGGTLVAYRYLKDIKEREGAAPNAKK